jgi:uncharacterized metal-binding protein
MSGRGSVRGPFIGFLIGLVIIIVMIGMVYLADIIIALLDKANQSVADATGVEKTTEYSRKVEELAPLVASILVALVIAVIAFTSLHMKKR